MALAIGIKKGSILMIGEDKLEVLDVHGLRVKVRMYPQDGGDIDLDDQERQQLLPQVFVSTAKSRKNDGRTRLVFEAPREIKITRESESVY